jgi:hypothetical protein
MAEEKRESLVPPEWVQHEHTAKLRQRFRGELDDARKNLMASARKSMDPDVRAEHAQVVMLERFVTQLSGGEGGMQ